MRRMMDQDVLRTNMLAIAVAGLLMLLTGVLLYIFRDNISDNVRFFLPIPPLGVASYIFVFNMYNFYNGQLPQGSWATAKEILYSTAVAGLTFGVFTFLLIFIIYALKR
jgi:hypothetical protein